MSSCGSEIGMAEAEESEKPDFPWAVRSRSRRRSHRSSSGRWRRCLSGAPRRRFFAVGANCMHYHGELSQALVVGDALRCPLHHPCFSLRTGEALSAAAPDPIPCSNVEGIGGSLSTSKNLLKNSNGTWGVVGQGFSPDVSDGKTRRPSGPEACSCLQKLNLRG